VLCQQHPQWLQRPQEANGAIAAATAAFVKNDLLELDIAFFYCY
jgi:hypothetical protein